jgi:hypothetical protein
MKEGQKSHRERKNGRSDELCIEKRRKKNAERPKQIFIPGVGFVRAVAEPVLVEEPSSTNWRSYPRHDTVNVKQTL